jgi:hypothetical protein
MREPRPDVVLEPAQVNSDNYYPVSALAGLRLLKGLG